ncbi:hypothetical protein ACFSM7_06455 [Clavibacter michiganensis subsp. tessellarius]|uniref:hypothetical protein n=1 Tax=Clavibacter tessellarius TaxID=31965 RepID=UPI003634AD85
MGSTFVVILIGAGPDRAHRLVVEPMGGQPRASRRHSGAGGRRPRSSCGGGTCPTAPPHGMRDAPAPEEGDPVRRNPPDWTPPGLWAPLSGHLTVALVKAPIVVVVSQALMLIPAWGPGSLDRTIGGATLMTLVFCAVEVVVERPFVVRRRLMAPGGWGFAVLPWLAGATPQQRRSSCRSASRAVSCSPR